jgi:hypothetical protein
MKKKIYILFVSIIANNLLAQELQLDVATLQKFEQLPQVVQDKLAACVVNYTKEPLDASYVGNTCQCIALELNFSKSQQDQLGQVLRESNELVQLAQDSQNVIALRNKIVLLSSDPIVQFLNQREAADTTNTRSNDNVAVPTNSQFNLLLGIFGLSMVLFSTLLFRLWQKVKLIKVEQSGSGKAEHKNSVDSFGEFEDRLKQQEESLAKQSRLLQALEEKIAKIEHLPTPPYKETNEVLHSNVAPIPINATQGTNVQTVLYAQQPLNGIFIKWSDHFTPRQTFFQIEPDTQRQDSGQFTLVNDPDTQQIAFNIPDTYLPSVACEIRNNGGSLSTQRNWKILSQGTVERQGGGWRITKPMVMLFD